MIKIFSVFTVLVFLSSTVRSFAFDTNTYDEIWIWSDAKGYELAEGGVTCTSDSDAESNLRVLDYGFALGAAFSIPIKEKPFERSNTILNAAPTSLVQVVENLGNGFLKVLVLSNENVDKASSRIGYVQENRTKHIYDHDISANYFGKDDKEKIVLRSFKNEVSICEYNNTLQKFLHKNDSKEFITFESKFERKLFLIRNHNLKLFKAARAEFSPALITPPEIKITPMMAPVEVADAKLINSGPDTPILTFTPPSKVEISEPEKEIIAGVEVHVGSTRDVVCTMSGDELTVRNQDKAINSSLPKAKNGTLVKIFQDVEPIKMRDYNLIKVQFSEYENKTGWISEDFVKLKSNCDSLKHPGAEYIEICTSDGGGVHVRDESLETRVKLVPDETKGLIISKEIKSKTISGEEYKFVEIKFENEEESYWTPNKFLSSGSCAIQKAEAQAEAAKHRHFPLVDPPKKNYVNSSDNPRNYKAGRKTKTGARRWHAGVDLYSMLSGGRYTGGQFRSISNGVIIRDQARFTRKGRTRTYEIAVLDDKTGEIYRYCEIKPNAKFFKRGQRVRAGAVLGNTKWTRLNRYIMLHFELYRPGASDLTVKKSNGLSRQVSKFMRHPHITNPTEMIRALELKSFGRTVK